MIAQKTCPKSLKSISVGTRMKIIQYLQKKSQNAGQVKNYFALTQPTISYHLNSLKKLGILSSKKRGREIYYFFNKNYPCKNAHYLKYHSRLNISVI